MTIQHKITKLELQLNKIFPVPEPDEGAVIALYIDLISHEAQIEMGTKVKSVFIVPENRKVRHADWEYFYKYTQRRKKEFGEKTYQEQINFCHNIKAAIDAVNGWID